MSDADLLVDDSGPIRTITLNRADAKNTLTAAMLNGLVVAIDEADRDQDGSRRRPHQRRHDVLCRSGPDVVPAGGVGPRATAPTALRPSLADVFTSMQHSTTPIVGKINGHAVGGGVGLVAACDLSYVRNDAKIGFTEVRLGVAPAVISVVCLPKLSRADAMETFLTGQRFSPDRAARMGLINAAVEPEQLDDHVRRIVSMILLGGPTGVSAAKDLINRVPTMDLERGVRVDDRTVTVALRRRGRPRGHRRLQAAPSAVLGAAERARSVDVGVDTRRWSGDPGAIAHPTRRFDGAGPCHFAFEAAETHPQPAVAGFGRLLARNDLGRHGVGDASTGHTRLSDRQRFS